MMNLLTPESLAELVSAQQPPCLSLYQPTHRHHPDNQQDPIRFGNLVKQLAASLLEKHSPAEAKPLLEPFEALARDQAFWDHTLDGLAVLSGSGLLRVFLLQRPVDERVVVADSFHTKPLRRMLQSLDRYQVLELSRHRIRLFEGNRDALDEIEPAPSVPRTIEDALGWELTDPHQTVSSHGGVGQGHLPMHHSTGGKKDEVDLDAEKYFRAVDRAVLEQHSNPSGLPLILAALPEHHHLFHTVSHNPFLVADGITLNTAALPLDEFRVLAWQTVEPEYRARLTTLVEAFEQARAKQLGSDDLAQVAEAAINGRVATLLIEADRQLAGRLDSTTGRIESAGLSHPEVDDLLDDLGEIVAAAGGRVVVMPSQCLPTQTGVAAVFRF
ncbi:baeRF3 domain-containing protein [Thiocapsa imhoffii]